MTVDETRWRWVFLLPIQLPFLQENNAGCTAAVLQVCVYLRRRVSICKWCISGREMLLMIYLHLALIYANVFPSLSDSFVARLPLK